MEFSRLLRYVDKVQEAQGMVYEAQRDLREAKARLIDEMIVAISINDLIHSGVISINMGTIRRLGRFITPDGSG